MSGNSSFDALMARLKAGDEDAAAAVFRRFANRLIGLARSRMAPLVRTKVDPEDVLQSVFKSFFLRYAQGQWQLGDWHDLWAVLTVLTVRKCGHRAEHFHAQKRDVRRETSPQPDASDAALDDVALDREPTPDEAAMLAETVEQIMRDLEGYHRDIFRMALQGYSTAEIAAEVGVTERSVLRVLKRVRERLASLAAVAESNS
jgi:RNA polymerase sigma-70 factor (ECF subfamily)